MHLDGVSLQYFRGYQDRTFLFPQPVTLIVGSNAAGKTSVIEAIALLATGNSFRAEEVAEMVQFEQELARVKGKVSNAAESIELEAVLTRGQVGGKAVQSRLYSVNNVRRRKKDFVGKFFTVVFRPEDMRLIEGSPTRRRQFIDTVLSVSDPAYAQALKTYEDALKRRNKLLLQVREHEMPATTLTYWTNLILKHGEVLQEKRRNFFSTFIDVPFPMNFIVEYLPSIISEERLTTYADREIAAGHTLIGPHKDDFEVKLTLNSHLVSIAAFGSRGQQRLAVLWLKVCELMYLQDKTSHRPLLLLDDILSELDQEHRADVISLLQEGQAIVTTTEIRVIEELQTHITQELEVVQLSS